MYFKGHIIAKTFSRVAKDKENSNVDLFLSDISNVEMLAPANIA